MDRRKRVSHITADSHGDFDMQDDWLIQHRRIANPPQVDNLPHAKWGARQAAIHS
jgi:hypothetical protein